MFLLSRPNLDFGIIAFDKSSDIHFPIEEAFDGPGERISSIFPF